MYWCGWNAILSAFLSFAGFSVRLFHSQYKRHQRPSHTEKIPLISSACIAADCLIIPFDVKIFVFSATLKRTPHRGLWIIKAIFRHTIAYVYQSHRPTRLKLSAARGGTEMWPIYWFCAAVLSVILVWQAILMHGFDSLIFAIRFLFWRRYLAQNLSLKCIQTLGQRLHNRLQTSDDSNMVTNAKDNICNTLPRLRWCDR